MIMVQIVRWDQEEMRIEDVSMGEKKRGEGKKTKTDEKKWDVKGREEIMRMDVRLDEMKYLHSSVLESPTLGQNSLWPKLIK